MLERGAMIYDNISYVLYHTSKGQFASAFIFGLAAGLLILYSVRREVDKRYIKKDYEYAAADEYADRAVA